MDVTLVTGSALGSWPRHRTCKLRTVLDDTRKCLMYRRTVALVLGLRHGLNQFEDVLFDEEAPMRGQ